MKRTLFLPAALLAAAICGHAVTITAYTTLAPNVYGSPSYAAWEANAVYALAHGLTAYGDPNQPTYYYTGSSFNSAEVMVTGFPSWMGFADPGSVFGPAYASEGGNRMTFPLAIDGQGVQFSIADLSFASSSTDPENALAFSRPAGSYTYSSGYVGILKGEDGVVGTADDVYITSGANTQLVDYLVGRGSGNSYAAYCPGCTVAEQQAMLTAEAGSPGVFYNFTGSYSLRLANGDVVTDSATFDVTPVPEPATAATLAAAMLLLGALTRRRARR